MKLTYFHPKQMFRNERQSCLFLQIIFVLIIVVIIIIFFLLTKTKTSEGIKIEGLLQEDNQFELMVSSTQLESLWDLSWCYIQDKKYQYAIIDADEDWISLANNFYKKIRIKVKPNFLGTLKRPFAITFIHQNKTMLEALWDFN